MKLPVAPAAYDRLDQTRTRSALEQADARSRKHGENIELVNDFLILRSPNGTRYKLTVSDLGALSAVPA